MSDSSYNGWTNYPTWAVNLWLSNDEPLYREAVEIVNGQHNVSPGGTAFRANCADALRLGPVTSLRPTWVRRSPPTCSATRSTR
jgi:hypothetical protein